MSDLASQLSQQLRAKTAENLALRALVGDVYTALLAAGWREDELIQRVREARHWPPAGEVQRREAAKQFSAGMVPAE